MPYCMRKAPGDPLEIGKHAIAPLLVQAGKLGGKNDHRSLREISARFVLNDWGLRQTARPLSSKRERHPRIGSGALRILGR